MQDRVYVLQHEHEAGGCDHTKLLGVFSKRRFAEDAQKYFETQVGFRNYLDCFSIDEITLDKHLWSEGFITWQESLDSIKETE